MGELPAAPVPADPTTEECTVPAETHTAQGPMDRDEVFALVA